MGYLYGFLFSQFLVAAFHIVSDIHFVLKNRTYNGARLMVLLMLLIPGAPLLTLIHVSMDKLERIILPKRWYFMPKMKKM